MADFGLKSLGSKSQLRPLLFVFMATCCQDPLALFICPPSFHFLPMNKSAVLALIQKTLADELEILSKGARASFAAATDPDSKAENKYDTRTLEASYVARGQAQRVAELQQAVHQYQALKLDLDSIATVCLGALVTLDKDQFYFMGPAAGGTEVITENQEILVITPASPLGQKLMGKKVSDKVQIGSGPFLQITDIL